MPFPAFINEFNNLDDCIIGNVFVAISQKYIPSRGKIIKMIKGHPKCGINCETNQDNKMRWRGELRVFGFNTHDVKGDYLSGMALVSFRSQILGKTKPVSKAVHKHGGQLAEIIGKPAICTIETTSWISQTVRYQQSVRLTDVVRIMGD